MPTKWNDRLTTQDSVHWEMMDRAPIFSGILVHMLGIKQQQQQQNKIKINRTAYKHQGGTQGGTTTATTPTKTTTKTTTAAACLKRCRLLLCFIFNYSN